MKIPIKKLINPYILNQEWVNFQGDSEYTNEKGELKYGNWTFKKIIKNNKGNILGIDSVIDENQIYEKNRIKIKNDNNKICIIEINY